MKAIGLPSVIGISLLLFFCQLNEIDAKSKRHTSASWSAWNYGECSRTCGGGVQKATRTCMNNRSDGQFHCDGPSTEHIACNTQDCPDRIDFRALQCSMYNKKPFKGHYHKWKPFYAEKNPCALVCAVNRTFHVQLADKVVDGTRCHPERYDVCVNGKCKAAGCDRKLGSTLRDDACGVCGGEGKDCKTIKGHYTNETNNGYKDIITILKGATNIQILEPTNTKNYFAVRNVLGKFYVNSQWKLVNHKKFIAAGTMFRYQKGPDGQLLIARGPTTDSLTFVLVGKGDPAQINYEYYIPGKGHVSKHVERKRMRRPKRKYLTPDTKPKGRSSRQHEEPDKWERTAKALLSPSADTPLPSGDAPPGWNPRRSTINYRWKHGVWTKCSSSCGEGVQRRAVLCYNMNDRVPVEGKCEESEKPDDMQKCEMPCDASYYWVDGSWTDCSKDCGGGEMSLISICEHVTPAGRIKVEDKYCEDTVGRSPTQMKVCNEHGCPETSVPRENPCWQSLYGCCADRRTAASGPEKAGCPKRRTSCQDSEYGCCPDGVNAARGERYAGCGTGCQESEYGCCPDGVNAARGERYAGCRTGCQDSEYGCCPDGVNAARGERYAGCGTGCQDSEYGCCPDGVNAARGERYAGCRTGCQDSEYGCCPDGVNAARGERYAGCGTGCQESEYGCCPDGVNAARGERYAGCRTGCQDSEYGCCPDGVNAARGERYAGCGTGCQESEYGCCPDGVNAARGERYAGCRTGCQDSEYGCCPDGVNAARGERYAGCGTGCQDSEYGCCPDGVNAARGERYAGCRTGCQDSEYGCCLDGVNAARGERYAGCPSAPTRVIPEAVPTAVLAVERQGVCNLPQVKGSCFDYVSRWSYDASSGNCVRFWYGGCDGNANRFETQEACASACKGERPRPTATSPRERPRERPTEVPTERTRERQRERPRQSARLTPVEVPRERPREVPSTAESYPVSTGHSMCELGKDPGTCTTYAVKWFYNTESQRCEQFWYNGCGGNANRFDTEEACQEKCRRVTRPPERGSTCVSTPFGCCDDGVTAARGPQKLGCPKEDCQRSQFGCCPDGTTASRGQDHEGCPTRDCRVSRHGCCQDGVSFARGENYEGCRQLRCDESPYGCCPDGVSFSQGDNYSGCRVIPECERTEYGCCPDQQTTAQGPNGEGCCHYTEFGCCPDGLTISGPNHERCRTQDCRRSKYACCRDGVNFARGENFKGCPSTDCRTSAGGCCPDGVTFVSEGCTPPDCHSTSYGCCPDGQTIARGYYHEGCTDKDCRLSRYGCCSDGDSYAKGEDYEGCPTCRETRYGCCPDGITVAKGENYLECTLGSCHTSDYGCCPDMRTAASGPEHLGCKEKNCQQYRYGCCEDGVTYARGRDMDGCPRNVEGCASSRYGCCEDRRTAAQGPDRYGCPETLCDRSEFGCCEDGVTFARGPNYEGCQRRRVGGCESTRHGCCEDRRTAAQGPDRHGCPETLCDRSEFGCCEDGVTFARGPDYEGCQRRRVGGCESTRHGCCEDRRTAAQGPDRYGCPETLCDRSEFGCCEDGVTFARGPDYEGCQRRRVGGCESTRHGCCEDRRTAAQGPDRYGCPETLCDRSEFGCCEDGVTFARGPDYEGCQRRRVGGCESTRHGCCEDRRTAAQGPDRYGCPETLCDRSEFGCCEDGVTFARGPDYEGCQRRRVGGCESTRHGCCEDRRTAAQGPDRYGCPETRCDRSEFGCCEDGVNFARGPNYEGCQRRVGGCESTPHGCCEDRRTAAQGPDRYGCPETRCDRSEFGCCEDGVNFARGPNYDGCQRRVGGCESTPHGCCEDRRTAAQGPDRYGCPETRCDRSEFGCCEDGVNFARGPDHEGCRTRECSQSRYGCCQDGVTSARGENFGGCEIDVGCEASVYGCCPDMVTAARGRDYEGCAPGGCRSTRYGCCPDRITAADGPNYAGCETRPGCLSSRYGCCPDRVTEARGPDYAGCAVPTPSGRADCELDKDPGPCDKQEIKWYFNVNSSMCEQFWYGGCEGNNNKFDSSRECERKCRRRRASPTTAAPLDLCHQPYDEGTCSLSNAVRRWYYEESSRSCQVFMYSGCDGNGNNFESEPVCMQRCFQPDPHYPGIFTSVDPSLSRNPSLEICHLKLEAGDCSDDSIQWHYDKEDGLCKNFTYSGCHGNSNRFPSKKACEEMCSQKAVCDLKEAYGTCTSDIERYRYDAGRGDCVVFGYSGCDGNANNFVTLDACRNKCGVHVQPTIAATTARPVETPKPTGLAACSLEKDESLCPDGIQRTRIAWYYDLTWAACQQFNYSGCGGNNNRFESAEVCTRTCNSRDICQMPKDSGICLAYSEFWHFNKETKTCETFVYGGCGGNANRFATKNTCKRTCRALMLNPTKEPTVGPGIHSGVKTIDSCLLPQKPATCSLPVNEDVWFYNMTEGICQHFQAGECSYNDNKFSTEEECEKTCDPRELCLLPRDPGTCYAYSKQYYFNPNTKSCDDFVYGGCGGNANRFPTVRHCEKSCNALMDRNVNTGPVRLPDDLKIAIMMCHLTPVKGPCRSNERKWYYEVKEARCRQFTYGGCQGNNNRFETREECEQICNPQVICSFSRDAGNCTHFHRGYYFNSMVGRCEHLTHGACYGNANRFYSFELCERTCNAASTPTAITTITPAPSVKTTAIVMCHLPPEKGPCRSADRKWYYELKEAKCRQFTYGGCQGNTNRFETREECEYICNPQVICSLPRNAGNCTHFHRGYYFNSMVGRCEHFTYGDCYGNANRFYSGELCERTCSAAPRPTEVTTIRPVSPIKPTAILMCHLPPEKGPCRSNDRKWYYEVKEARCRQFSYGGCQGNNNRFETREECEQICNRQAICSFPKDVGNCTPFHRGYYFNSMVGRCEHLNYGDCYGNANRFYSSELCERTCSAAPRPTEVTTLRPVSPVKPTVDDCHLPKVSGSCRGRISAWYHDIVENTCKQFYYGGCEGNGNRFQTKEECQRICNSYDICHLPEEGGLCFAYSEQFYFNRQSRRCEQFVYGGCGGNANRFATLEKCNNACQDWIGEPTTPVTTTVSKAPTRPVEFCHLEKEVGTCNSQMSTWYYDSADNTCKHFYYGGCGGNGNRFQTREECESICNPNDICNLRKDSGRCNARFVQYYFNPKTRQCEEFNYGGCDGNANRFVTISRCFAVCHSVIEQTTIQPRTERPEVLDKPVDACHLEKVVGPCRSAIPSWHYDAVDHECKFFLYGGCQGNANNFKSKPDCQHWCRPESICELPKDSGKCYAYSDQYFFNPSTKRCEQFTYGGCGGNANRFTSPVKCMDVCKSSMPMTTTPITTDVPIFNPGVCLLPKDSGKCYAYSEQYYFNPSTKRCEQFVYGGCGGNANRFSSSAKCVDACKSFMEMTTTPIITDIPILHPADACNLEKEVGPCRSRLPVWHYDTVDHECKLFYYGGCQGNANNFKTKQECHQTCNPYSICELPKESGKCYAYSEQYHFNPNTKRCEEFVYGGCGGNANRFPTVLKCMELCKHLMPTGIPETKPHPHANPGVCLLPKDSGKCYAYSEQYYFNPSTKRCEQFVYGGCGGNANRFSSPAKCVDACKSFMEMTTTPIITDIPIFHPADACNLEKEVGPCRSRLPVWHYDAVDHECKQFYYGGCQGNANNFKTKQECHQTCNPYSICELPKESGKCYAYSEQYHFNPNTKRCEEFVYGGCGGNANRFPTVLKCMELCKPLMPTGIPETTPLPHANPADACNLEKKVGPCRSRLPVWHYDAVDHECKLFYYGGCQGNANNFKTKQECHQTCNPYSICELPKESGKCYAYSEQYHFNPNTKRCEEFVYGGCGGNANRFPTVIKCMELCKPLMPTEIPETTTRPHVNPELCQLPRESGPCFNYSEIYYFDQESNRCEQFVYSGCGGNSNRFATLSECRRVCRSVEGTKMPVTKTDVTDTPKRDKDVCQLRKLIGPCSQNVTAWYFNEEYGVCIMFKYSGCGGNRNNFNTLKECEHVCQPTNDMCNHPLASKKCPSSQPFWVYDRLNKTCRYVPTGKCDDNPLQFTSEMSCKKQCAPQDEHAKDVCHFKMEEGPCRAYIRVWYYNTDEAICKPFIYGGCEGNKNRFDTKQNCDMVCNKHTICTLKKDPGICYGYTDAFYYNAEKDTCEHFVYGGCGGNANRFSSMNHCQEVCGGHISNNTHEPHPTEPGKCQLHPDSGPCQEKILSWYFDYKTGVCSRFYYTGCDGNENRFKTEYECKTSCRSFNPMTTMHTTFAPVTDNSLVENPLNRFVTIHVVPKETLKLHCGELIDSTGAVNPVIWTHDGQDIIPGPRRQTEDLNLIIYDVESKDAGMYTCREKSNTVTPTLDKYKVVIKVPVTIDHGPSHLRALPNHKLTIPCQAHGVPKPLINWYKDSKEIHNDNHYHIFENGTLLIDPFTPNDVATYKCLARNGYEGKAEKEVNVTIQDSLNLEIKKSSPNMHVGDKITFTCIADGYPNTRLQWFFKDREMYSDHRITVRNGVLIIKNATYDNSGVYTCRGTHAGDQVNKDVIVRILSMPDEVPQVCEDRLPINRCRMIVAAKLCKRRTFHKNCCVSCTRSGTSRR